MERRQAAERLVRGPRGAALLEAERLGEAGKVPEGGRAVDGRRPPAALLLLVQAEDDGRDPGPAQVLEDDVDAEEVRFEPGVRRVAARGVSIREGREGRRRGTTHMSAETASKTTLREARTDLKMPAKAAPRCARRPSSVSGSPPAPARAVMWAASSSASEAWGFVVYRQRAEGWT